MSKIRPERETCPICGSRGNCIVHDYYDRSVIDFSNGEKEESGLCVMRVFCTACNHAHAILPDIIVPYSHHSLLFILSVLAEYFCFAPSKTDICRKYCISIKTLDKWLKLWFIHKKEWLGILADHEQSDASFLRRLRSLDSFSAFGMSFFLKHSLIFLQSHKNPVAAHSKNAHYRQAVFAPDISIW